MDGLSQKDRMRLMKFVCSFAWADLGIRTEERRFISGLIQRLDLSEEERVRVKGWLDVPPEPDSVDPTMIPHAHRKIFIECIEAVIASDNDIAPEERENLSLLQELLG